MILTLELTYIRLLVLGIPATFATTGGLLWLSWFYQMVALLIYASATSISFTAAYLQHSAFQVLVISPQLIAELITLPSFLDRRRIHRRAVSYPLQGSSQRPE
jgi:hypothetical protein